MWNTTTPTATEVTLGSTDPVVNVGGASYVAYLFATVPGISKIGTLHRQEALLIDIDCGFTTVALDSVLVKSANAGGDWYVYDNAINGITISANPYLRFNSNGGPTTDGDWVEPTSTGFRVNSGNTSVNANGTDYIFYIVS